MNLYESQISFAPVTVRVMHKKETSSTIVAAVLLIVMYNLSLSLRCVTWWLFLSFIQSLRLLSYLLLNGSDRVVNSTRDHLYDIRQLENYTFTDEFGQDQGINGKIMRI